MSYSCLYISSLALRNNTFKTAQLRTQITSLASLFPFSLNLFCLTLRKFQPPHEMVQCIVGWYVKHAEHNTQGYWWITEDLFPNYNITYLKVKMLIFQLMGF